MEHKLSPEYNKVRSDNLEKLRRNKNTGFRWLDPRSVGPRLLSASVCAGPRDEAFDAAESSRIRSNRASEKLRRIRSTLHSSLHTEREQDRTVRHHDPKIAAQASEQRLKWLQRENTDDKTAQQLRDDENTRERLALSRMVASRAIVRRGGAECHELNLLAETNSIAERIRQKNPPPVPVRVTTF